MKRTLCFLGSILLSLLACLLFSSTAFAAAGPPPDEDAYWLHLQPQDSASDSAQIWYRTRHTLTRLREKGAVARFEFREEENLVSVSASPAGLYRLQKLPWVVGVVPATDWHGEAPAADRLFADASTTALMAPNTVTGLVDLPDGAPVEAMSVYADQVDGWGWEWTSTDASGDYTLTLDADGWWDIELGDVPWTHSSTHARPPDWSRRLNITGDTVQNFTLQPISYTITGTLRLTGTGELVPYEGVAGQRSDGGHNPYDFTDLNGVYSLGVTTGTYTLRPWATSSSDGYAPPFEAGEVVTVTDASVEDVTLWMLPLDKTIRGTVTDKDTGQPIGGAQLDLVRTDGLFSDYDIETATGALTGTYTVSVTSGVYQVSLDSWGQPEDYALPITDTQMVTVTTSDVTGVDFVLLPKNRSLSGRVTVRGTDTGVAGAQLSIYPGWIYTDTDSGGYYTFTQLAEGPYTVYLENVPAGYAEVGPTYRQVVITETNRGGVDFEVLLVDKNIHGTVREAGGPGLVDVDVSALLYDSDFYFNTDTSTDASGAYTLSVPSGNFSVRVDLPDGYAGRRHLRAPADASGVDFDLEPRSQTITGQVTDHLSNPLAGVSVFADNYACYNDWYSWDYWDGHNAQTTTDASGNYTLQVIPGSYEVHVEKLGYPIPPYQDAEAGDNGVDFTMPEGFHIHGHATSNGEGVSGVNIDVENTAECASERHDRVTWTDASGYYSVTVGAGTYSVSAYHERYDLPPLQTVTVGPDQTVDFDLKKRYIVTGTVRYPEGQPASYAQVTAFGGPMSDSAWGDANGHYILWLSAGIYDLAAELYNWPDPPAITGLAVYTDTYNVDFTAPEAYTVTGVVRRHSGTPWGDIEMVAEGQGSFTEDEYAWTDDKGAYALRVGQDRTYAFYPGRWHYPANPLPITLTVNADTADVDFQYLDVVTITGSVEDTEGASVPNVEIYVDGTGANGVENWDYGYTFFDGTYALFFALGSYAGEAEGYPCYTDSEFQSFTLGAGGVSDLDFTIARRCSTITGRVTDAQGNPVCLASVQVEDQSGWWLDSVVTAEDWHGPEGIGTYWVWVPVGTWDLEAYKSGYGSTEPLMRTAEISACSTILTGQDFQFAPAGALDHFEFDYIGDQRANQPFGVRITARDAVGLLVTDYDGSADLSDSTGTIVPALVDFANGIFNGSVTIAQKALGVVIVATETTDPSITGSSNPFNVGIVPSAYVYLPVVIRDY